MSSAERPELDAARALRELAEHRVDFVVIGGIAAVLHGSARATFDLDICFADDDENLHRLGEVLVGLSARLRGVDDSLPFVPDRLTLRQIEVLTLSTDVGDLDVLARPIGAPSYAELRRRADVFDIEGHEIAVASMPDLIAMKLAASRPKDLADVDELQTILRLRGA